MFHYLLPFFRQLHNSVFPKLFIFLSKELFQVPFTVSREQYLLELFHFPKGPYNRGLPSNPRASLVAQTVKNLPAMQETQVRSLCWEDPLEKGMATHSSILAGKSYGQRSLVGYSPWGRKELDTTERLTLSLSFLQAPVPPHVPGARWQEPGHSRCWRAPSHAAFRQRL